MAKIRGVKPEFWTDEDICQLSIPARLFFIGMWNFACDNGHLQDKPAQIKRRIMPDDLIDPAELVDEIARAELIERTGGWITIPNLTRHQKPHKRWWSTCDKPGCSVPDGASHKPNNRGATVAPPLSNRCATADGDGEVDCEFEGEGEKAARPPRKSPERPLPADWKPNDKHAKWAEDRNLDIEGEADSYRNHALMHDRRLVNWDAGFTNWLKKAYPKPKAAPEGNSFWDRRPFEAASNE